MFANSKAAASVRLTAVPMLAPCRTIIPRVIIRARVEFTADPTCVRCRMAKSATTAGPLQAAAALAAAELRAAVRFTSARPAVDAPAAVAAHRPAEAAWVTAADTPVAVPALHPGAGTALHRVVV